MGTVEEEAVKGAEKKGLHGEEEKKYVGGVFNRIKRHSVADGYEKRKKEHDERKEREKPKTDYEKFLERTNAARKDAEEENRLRIGPDRMNDQQRESYRKSAEIVQRHIEENEAQRKKYADRAHSYRQQGALKAAEESDKEAEHYAQRVRMFKQNLEAERENRIENSRQAYAGIAKKHEEEFKAAQRRAALQAEARSKGLF